MNNKLQEPRKIHPSILINETIEKFGYDPRILKENSCRLVIKRFECCGMITERMFRPASTQHSCQKCANKKRSIDSAAQRSITTKEYFKHHRHPRLGSVMTEYTKRKLLAANTGRIMSDKTREKLSLSNMGRPCPQKALDYWKDPSHLGINHHRYGKKPSHSYKIWYTKKDGTKICFRSTWEARVAKHLDKNNIQWEYESKTFPVSYIWKNIRKDSNYISDFWLPLENKIIEVKGRWQDEYIFKFFALIKQYRDIKIEVWDREILREMGIKTTRLRIKEIYE